MIKIKFWWRKKWKTAYVDNLHLLLVIHVVHSQTTLVNEEVQSRIFLDQQFVWKRLINEKVNLFIKLIYLFV